MRKMRIDWLFAVLALFAVAAHAQATFKVLYNLGTKSGDPWNPVNSGIIAQGRDGKLYSTAPQGGANGGSGAVFKITPAGMLIVLHTFSGTDGLSPSGGLTLGTDGNFYGTTSGGGFQSGTIFKITAGGSLTTLYSFTNGVDGSAPTAPPIQGIDGKFYGTASNGDQGKGFYGSVYKVTSSGRFTVLHSLTFDDGAFPFASLVQGTNGNFYGTTLQGSSNNEGTVYKITPSGKFGVIFKFDGTHGHQVAAPLVQGSDGNFYGTTVAGGTNDVGVVFKITPNGAITILHSFAGSGDGADPYGGLVQATDGNFYGTTSMATGNSGCGTIFRISPSGNFKTLYTFPSDGSKGCNPDVTLMQHTNGILYGDTFAGGTGNNSHGVFYSLSASLPPFVSLLPYSGKVGKTIEFLGQGFTSSTTISFNGTAATPTVKSSAYLTAAVPSAATTGFVTVKTSSATLKSNKKFRVIPQITGFKPTSGSVGTLVTITGVSLTQTTNVIFGGVKASFKVVNDTKVTATVPTGALTGKITITTPGGTAVSSEVFTVT